MLVSSVDAETENAAQTELCVDAHLHLWHYTPAEHAWIDSSMAPLQRDFSTENLIEPMQAAGVQYGIAVQARQDLLETRELLAIASRSPCIAGVVGWLPLADLAGLSAALEEFSHDRHFVGVRHIAQAEPSGFLEDSTFNAGIKQLKQHEFVYDVLIHAGQMEEAIRFVDCHPSQSFVLDHLAKPRIKDGQMEPWSRCIRELAKRANVACKVSGLVTEASWQSWSEDQLRPYLDVAAKAFGPHRLLAGSDWPVCLLASSYAGWWQVLERYFAAFSVAEQALIFGGNAARLYHLALPKKT